MRVFDDTIDNVERSGNQYLRCLTVVLNGDCLPARQGQPDYGTLNLSLIYHNRGVEFGFTSISEIGRSMPTVTSISVERADRCRPV
jgi:hypothetical protein